VANYQAIVRQRPEVREFIRNRRWVHRGEVVVYGANTRCDAFSTDEQGFRHSVFEGKAFSVADCLKAKRYGVVLGSSHLYGFGLAGNENSIPSLLAEQFGMPFANVSIPEANSRNLHSLLKGCIAQAKAPPAMVIHMSGGDFTSFCFTSLADPIFGSPNLRQIESALSERGIEPDSELFFPALLSFNGFWTNMIVQLCRANEAPFLLASDTTFFEKSAPSDADRHCKLGVPSNPPQARQFDTHKAYFTRFCEHRNALAAKLGVPIAGPGPKNDLSYVDEFHYDRPGAARIAADYAEAIGNLL